jgi:propionyl-CoA synthetase
MDVNRTELELVDWIKKPRPGAEGTLNTCYNALDRHVVHGRGDDLALVHVGALVDTRQVWTYARLLERVAAFAGALRALGVRYGGRVLVSLPATPEAVVSMLACARLGAVHVVVPQALGGEELASRIDGERPDVVVTGGWGTEASRVTERKEALDEALGLAAHPPHTVVVRQSPRAPVPLVEPRDVDWDLALAAGAGEPAECMKVRADDPLYVVHEPAADGTPTRTVRRNGEHALAMAAVLRGVEDQDESAVWQTDADLSTQEGHTYLVYAPLFNGATSVLLERGSQG